MAGTIISGTITSSVTLTDSATENPATVDATGFMTIASGSALTGASGTSWVIVNQGKIVSTGSPRRGHQSAIRWHDHQCA